MISQLECGIVIFEVAPDIKIVGKLFHHTNYLGVSCPMYEMLNENADYLYNILNGKWDVDDKENVKYIPYNRNEMKRDFKRDCPEMIVPQFAILLKVNEHTFDIQPWSEIDRVNAIIKQEIGI